MTERASFPRAIILTVVRLDRWLDNHAYFRLWALIVAVYFVGLTVWKAVI